MIIGEKIKKIRESEGMAQFDFCVATGINISTLRNCEQGRRLSLGSTELLKITQHPKFEKYTLWLMTDQTAPQIGQVSPELEQQRSA